MLVVPVTMYGAILAFQAYSYARGTTFGFLRFYIVAIPFAACLAMLAVPDGARVPAKRRGRYAPAPSALPSTRPLRSRYVAVAAAFALCLPAAGWGMTLPHYAPQEYALGAVLAPDPYDVSARMADKRRIAATFSTERNLARYLDSLNLPQSSIIADTVFGFAIVVRHSVRPGLRPAAQRPYQQRDQVSVVGALDGARRFGRAEPALSHSVRNRCRRRHPGTRSTQ
jgi:hypothetical protein